VLEQLEEIANYYEKTGAVVTEKRTSVRIISPTINESLEMGAILHLVFVFLAQIPITFRLGRIELGEISGETNVEVRRSTTERSWLHTPCNSRDEQNADG
jgi:hypothetical protein